MNNLFNIPTVKALDTKSMNDIKKEIIQGITDSAKEFTDQLDKKALKKWLDDEESRLNKSLETDDWKSEFQGKVIFRRFCMEVLNEDPIRVRQAYVDIALIEKPQVFNDIISIIQSFS